MPDSSVSLSVNWLRGKRYRAWSRLLHRFNLHHTRRIGPLEDEDGDGVYIIKCDWCGMGGREPVDRFAKIERASTNG